MPAATVALLAAACTHAGPSTARNDSLVLAGKTFELHHVRYLGLGEAVLVDARTTADEKVIVDVAGDKLGTLDFTADGVTYFWEPTSTGGAPTPLLLKDGSTYTVTGKIKELHDYKKFSDFAFTATCPGWATDDQLVH